MNEEQERILQERSTSVNEKFYTLPKEKQTKILNAAMEVFARNEYNRASTDLIATKAEISKGLLFYYFHNNKELYLYVYNYVEKVVENAVVDDTFAKITDFFEMLEYSASVKARLMKENPYILEFATRAFFSKKEEVSEDLNRINSEQIDQLYQQYFKCIDYSKFRDGIDPLYLYKMLVWMTDGYMHQAEQSGIKLEVDTIQQEFHQWVHMMKNMVYKEEYLDIHKK